MNNSPITINSKTTLSQQVQQKSPTSKDIYIPKAAQPQIGIEQATETTPLKDSRGENSGTILQKISINEIDKEVERLQQNA